MTVIRIPNLPNGQVVDANGNATDDEMTFRHALITGLQNNFGSEGCVVPTQSDFVSIPPDPLADSMILRIQNNREPDPVTGFPGAYTCGFGRFLYDETNNRILVSIDGGGSVPVFMEVTLTVPVPPV